MTLNKQQSGIYQQHTNSWVTTKKPYTMPKSTWNY